MATKTTLIYMPLLDEGTSVVRPTQGKQIKDKIFQVLPTEDYDASLEAWAFLPGSIVECETEVWDNKEILVAKKVWSSNK